MRNTPLDHLLHTAVTHKKNNPLYGQFYELLSQHPLSVCRWPEWPDVPITRLCGDLDFDVSVENNERPHFFLFSDKSVINELYHRPTIVDIAEGVVDVWPSYHSWRLSGLMVYKASDVSFDVIGLMTESRSSLLLPEIQLNFTKTPEGWYWDISKTGFVNPFVYSEILSEVNDVDSSKVQEPIDYYGNTISMYLGSYKKWLETHGAWKISPAKPAKVKYNKKGEIRKFYRLATSGYLQFVPEETNG